MSNQENDQMYRMNSYKFDQNCTFLDAYEYRILRLMSTFHPNCYPSIAYLSNKCVLSESTIKRSIKRMIAKRIMKKNVGWKTIKDNETRVNEYFIDFDKIEELSNADRNNEDKIEEMMAFEVNDSLIKVPQTLSCGSHRPTIVPSIIVPINIYKADALEEGLETNPVSTSQIDNAEISSESSNDTDSKIQVAFNAEIELSMLSYLDDDEELLAYAKLAEDGPVVPLEEQNREIIAKQSDSSTADQTPAKALETSPTLQPHKLITPTSKTSENAEIDVMKIIRAWNIITIPHRLTIMRVSEMPNQKRWQNIRAFSYHLKIDANGWVEIFQHIVADRFWNGKGNAKGQKISKLSFDMILNADRLNNFIDEINHKKEVLAQKRINDIQFLGINTSTDLKKGIEL